MTPLQTITSRVERQLDDDWVPFLIDRIVTKHCSKGTRDECDCTYCQRKNQLSVECGDFNKLWQEYKRRFDPDYRPVGVSYGERYDRYYLSNSVDHMREIVKKEAKIELNELRQHVLYQ